MKTADKTVAVEDFLSDEQLIEKASSIHGLTFYRPHKHSARWETRSTGKYPLTKSFLERVQGAGFTFTAGMGDRSGMLYLSGNSHQPGADIWESDCWAWEKEKAPEQYLSISFHLLIDEKRRGVVVVPSIFGNCGGGAVHGPTIYKLALMLRDHFPGDVPPLLQRMKEEEGQYPIISWGEIGVAGIRSLPSLFHEAFGTTF